MKSIVLTIVVVILMLSVQYCTSNHGKSTGNDTISHKSGENAEEKDIPDSEKGIFKFEEETWAFGAIKPGEIVMHTYNFTNIGKSAIVISSVNASCGCTIPKWTETPIAPGEKGEINVRFDSSGKIGKINKSVKIFSNAKGGSKVLNFTVEVKE